MCALFPTAYRGSLAIFAEDELKRRGADLRYGTRNAEGLCDGRLIHRCTDIASGRWIDVTSGRGYDRDQVLAEGRS